MSSAPVRLSSGSWSLAKGQPVGGRGPGRKEEHWPPAQFAAQSAPTLGPSAHPVSLPRVLFVPERCSQQPPRSCHLQGWAGGCTGALGSQDSAEGGKCGFGDPPGIPSHIGQQVDAYLTSRWLREYLLGRVGSAPREARGEPHQPPAKPLGRPGAPWWSCWGSFLGVEASPSGGEPGP